MHAHVAMLAGGALLVTGLGFVAVSARSPEPSGQAGKRPVASAPQKAAAVSMIVYKSQT